MSGNLTSLLERHADEHPDTLAIIDGLRSVTWRELADRVRRVASGLQARGLGHGSRVLIFVPMSLELYCLLLGVTHLGAVAVFVDPGMGRPQLRAAVALAQPDAFVAVGKAHLLRFLSADVRRIPVKLRVRKGWLARFVADRDDSLGPAAVAPNDPALLTFTSGTTGTPKGAARSHAFLLAQHEALAEVLGTCPTDVEAPALPIFLLNSLAAGATAVIPPLAPQISDTDPKALVDCFLKHGVTTSAGSPALYRPMADYCRAKGVSLPDVRALFIGGAPVPPALLRDLAPVIPNGESWVVYGSTEAEPIAHIGAREVLSQTAAATSRGHGLCVGAPVDSVRVRLVDEEILVSGAHVNPTYYKNEAAVREYKVHDDDGTVWHRTGDVGRFDDAGRLWLLGRKEHVVDRDGRRLYPFAVELAARSDPRVAQAALLRHQGRVLLVLEGTGGSDGALEDLVALHTDIDEVRVLPRIPTDPRHNAKIDYASLRKLLGS